MIGFAAVAAIGVVTAASMWADREIQRRMPNWVREAERWFEFRAARRAAAGGTR